MIKRRFYKLEHGDKDAPSESSSSSDSELEAEASDDSEEEEEDDDIAQVRERDESGSSSSGYESEDSSAHDVNLDSSGLPTSDEDVGPQRDEKSLIEGHPPGQSNTDSVGLDPEAVVEKDKDQLDYEDCVVKHKSVFKCRLCPRIVCLSEETLNAHLNSKRHARSKILLKEGRLKHMLDIDGAIEESKFEEDRPPVASVQNSGKSRRKKRAWRGQKTRSKKPERLSSDRTRAKKRRSDDD